jgi:hypothetical protein
MYSREAVHIILSLNPVQELNPRFALETKKKAIALTHLVFETLKKGRFFFRQQPGV